MPQHDRLRITAILAHISFEEAFLQRNEIPINLMGSEVIGHSRWVYLVKWELTHGAFTKIWKPGDRLYCEELDEYNEKHGLTEDRNTSWALVHFTCVKEKENDEKGEKEQN
ncbi:unnamed protein product [Cylicocyclus nassatus]|uniref:Uncharacterized protein n=1 Tax=Cylicocyclus nassatus TaxID=53992 RepID=A0AA36M2B1_CYLNA|nr:unnamed protein product [Cylicocyclus nassatus]